MRRKGASLLLLVLLLHWGVALAAASPLLPGPTDPLSDEDQVYPFSLRYRQQVDEQIGLAQMPAAAGPAALFPTPCGLPAGPEGAPPARLAGTDLLYTLMSLRR
jgi:hypothetical protein